MFVGSSGVFMCVGIAFYVDIALYFDIAVCGDIDAGCAYGPIPLEPGLKQRFNDVRLENAIFLFRWISNTEMRHSPIFANETSIELRPRRVYFRNTSQPPGHK